MASKFTDIEVEMRLQKVVKNCERVEHVLAVIFHLCAQEMHKRGYVSGFESGLHRGLRQGDEL